MRPEQSTPSKRGLDPRDLINAPQSADSGAGDLAESGGDSAPKARPLGVAWAMVFVLGCGLLSWVMAGFPAIWQPLTGLFSGNRAIATFSVRATTESLSVVPAPSRVHGWVLPAGTWTLAPGDKGRGCAGDADFCQVKAEGASLLRVSGNARLRLDVTPRGLAVVVLPANDGEFSAEVEDNQGPITRSSSLLSFETAQPDAALRLPLIVESAVLGSDLYENAQLSGEDTDAWQPMLIDGNYEVVAGAGAGGARETFTVLEGVLDPGDVVTLGRNCRANEADSDQEGSLRGVASVEPGESGSRPVITVSLNACVPVSTVSQSLPGVSVRRFGATAPSTLSVPSQWVVFGRWPPWVSFWLTFLALMVVVQFLAGIAGYKIEPARRKAGPRQGAGAPLAPAPSATKAPDASPDTTVPTPGREASSDVNAKN